jgi:hypothetical protein
VEVEHSSGTSCCAEGNKNDTVNSYQSLELLTEVINIRFEETRANWKTGSKQVDTIMLQDTSSSSGTVLHEVSYLNFNFSGVQMLFSCYLYFSYVVRDLLSFLAYYMVHN